MDSYNDISPQGYSSPLLPTVPSQQKEASDRDRQETLAQLPLLKKVIDRLDNRIATTDSVKEALRLASSYKIDRETALVVLDIVRTQLETERNFINNKVKRAKP